MSDKGPAEAATIEKSVALDTTSDFKVPECMGGAKFTLNESDDKALRPKMHRPTKKRGGERADSRTTAPNIAAASPGSTVSSMASSSQAIIHPSQEISHPLHGYDITICHKSNTISTYVADGFGSSPKKVRKRGMDEREFLEYLAGSIFPWYPADTKIKIDNGPGRIRDSK